MSFLLGAKALKRLCMDQSGYAYHQAKLTPALFKGDEELAIFKFVDEHYRSFHVLPSVDTLTAQFATVAGVEAPEPSTYYAAKLATRYEYDLLTRTAQDVHAILKADKEATVKAETVVRDILSQITQQRYRAQILDVGTDAAKAVMAVYYNQHTADIPPLHFGWEFLDAAGGLTPGNVASFVGRPAMGKSYQLLWSAIHNWRERHQDTLFISMEMPNIEIAQRITAMYTGTPVGQLQVGGYSTKTYATFEKNVEGMVLEPAKLYVVDGNLAVDVDSIYSLAVILKCRNVFIDGAYMVRSANPRLDRYTRVAENVEHMKRVSSQEQIKTVASWQFAKTAVTKKKKASGAKEGLEDIAYSDAIGQVSSIVVGLMQDENVETLKDRTLTVLKGRNGQVGEFKIKWDFNVMDFSQVDKKKEKDELEHL